MKKLLLVIAAVAMMLPSCKKINEAIDDLDSRLDKLEQETIPTIDEQISAINTTLGSLDAMDKELKGYIDNLTTTASSLQEQINAANAKIEEVKTALQSEISTAKSEVLAQLATAKTELENELAQINATIETLKAKDAELDNKIAELRSYVDNELGKTTDWVNATFATLEQYNALVSEIATIKEQIKAINQSIADLETRLTTKINEDIATAVSTLNADIQQKVKEITVAYTAAVKTTKEEITAAYTAAIQTAINALDASLKAWVGEALSNYYTIAEVEAKITALQSAITDGDAALQEELKSLKSQLKTTATEITTAYKKAIEEAINTNNGVIDTNIANEIATVNQRITSEVATINAKIAKIESRLDNVEAKIAELLARIQSVSYIPTYDDGKATVEYNGDTSRVTIDFEVSPKDAVVELAKVWQNTVSVKAVYTQTRAVSFIDMPIVKFESDTASGVISVTVSAENLSEDFFMGTQPASARLSISDGNNYVTSNYIPMVAKGVPAESDIIPNNEIWYTSNDGYPASLKSYSFDANIVSNTYNSEKECWVLRFDDDITLIGDYAIEECSNLTSITVPNSVTSIGEKAFYNCSSLASVTIPDSVTEIGKYAFYGCISLTSVHISDLSAWCRINFNDNPLRNGANLYLCNKLVTKLTIPSDIVDIKQRAFYGCRSLISVTIPNSVISIGNSAFYDCASLTNVTIGNSVTSIESSTFTGCSSLKSVTIPSSVTTIKSSAFYNCSSLTSITIPDSVTSIADGAFDSCISLPIINNIRYADTFLVEAVDKTLTSYSIKHSTRFIQTGAFFKCNNVRTITIPDRVISIGNQAFRDCSNLTSVYCKPITPPQLGDFVFVYSTEYFELKPLGCTIYVPKSSTSNYSAAGDWGEYRIVGYDF